MRTTITLLTALCLAAHAASAAPELVMRGIASTADLSEIRMAFSPDGRRRLWGTVDRATPPRLRIVESVAVRGGWSTPRPVSFASAADDFDPSFTPDGRTLLFFSSRPGGQGGADLWQVPYDAASGSWGRPRNLGRVVNTRRDEYAPLMTPDGRLIFASNGHGGFGGHDLLISARGRHGEYRAPVNLGRRINTAADELDATMVGTATLVFTSGNLENGPLRLYRARQSRGGYAGRELLAMPVNCSDAVNNGPAWNPREPAMLYYSAACPDLGVGRIDIFRAPLPNAAR